MKPKPSGSDPRSPGRRPPDVGPRLPRSLGAGPAPPDGRIGSAEGPGATALLVLLALLLMVGCAGRREAPRRPDRGFEEKGIASWYGPGFHGNRTANGEVYDMDRLTAAHRSLPFGTVVEVRNLDNGRSVRVRINDRGPFVRGRVIDLSRAAADAIGMIGPGTARVRLRVVGSAPGSAPAGRGTAGYLVQVGAFRDKTRARLRADHLRVDYPTARVDSAGGWHRVLLGPFRKRAQAERLAEELRGRGLEAIVRGR